MAPPLLLLLLPALLSARANAIDIGIGGGGVGIGSGGGYSPPPGSEPSRCDFDNERQYLAFLQIQKFRTTITCDPLGITRSWAGTKVCEYTGFGCDDLPDASRERTVASVDFNGYRLATSEGADFVNNLPDLGFFHANTNNFSGSVSKISEQLQYIFEIDYSNNQLTGGFPDVTGVPNLLFLDIRFNYFTGCLPSYIFNTKLQVLFVNDNDFSGSIPDNLGNTKAKYLVLANNRFTGPIPRSIGKAAETLVEVLLFNNRLSGCLPYEIGLLKKATLFDASNNLLSGQIPRSFTCLSEIQELNLAGNRLFGEIPDVVCRLPNLQNLSLSNNYFTSLGPSCYKLIEKGVLDVRNNCLPNLPGCSDQRSPEECEKFECEHKSCPVTPNLYDIPCKAPWCGGGSPHGKHRRKDMTVTSSSAVGEPQS